MSKPLALSQIITRFRQSWQGLPELAKVDGVTTLVQRLWKGRQAEVWTYRFATHLPSRSGRNALLINWFELTITHEKTGELIFHNAWITNHLLSLQTVVALAQVGRTHWKIENETINVLKNHGYQVSVDKRSGITADPNRADEPRYIVDLVARLIAVSVATVKLVESLPDYVE